MLRHGAAPAILVVGVLGAYWACGDDKQAGDAVYDLLCPLSGTACGNAEGPLLAGVGVADITPEVVETFRDCGDDGLCRDDLGYVIADAHEDDGTFDGHPILVDGKEPFDDVNGNGYFDAVWIAGFGNARPAQGVHDALTARALVLRRGETTLALVSVDLVGYFYDEDQRLRRELEPALGVDLLLVSATHTHQGPDSLGIWGYDEGTTGVDPDHMAEVRAGIRAAVAAAVAGLVESDVVSATGKPDGHPIAEVAASRGINNLVMDYRDPVVLDDEMRLLHFRRKSDGASIATVVNWANHPESLCDENSYLSSDFAEYLRRGIEDGIHRDGVDVAGIGGTALYINGAVGGMQSPGDIQVVDLNGTVLTETCKHTDSSDDPFFARPRAIGELAAWNALRLLETKGEALASVDLSFASKAFRIPIENRGYHAMFITGVFYGACSYSKDGQTRPRRCIYDFDESSQITDGNLPWIETEVAVINLGPVQMVTAPGELLPEWFWGGYDGSHVGPQQTLLDPNNDMPPDLAAAPTGPTMRDQMTRPVRWLLGLTPDELGYIVPLYDFKLDDRQPYVEEAPGHHYEETNSLGPRIGPVWEEHVAALLRVVP